MYQQSMKRFPGLGLGRVRGLRRRLGCPGGCPKRPGLGQDVDPNAAQVVSSNPNPFYLPGLMTAPVYPSGVVDTGSYVTSGIYSPASPAPSPASPIQVILGMPASSTASPQTSSLSSYLPLVLLGVGGIALISVLKKR